MAEDEMKRMTLVLERSVDLEFDAEELVEDLPSEDIVQFVKEIDLAAEDWDVTLALYDHFAKLKEVYDKEVAEEEAAQKTADLGGEG